MDGKPVGNTPLTVAALPGTHVFDLSLTGYKSAQRTWNIAAGFSRPQPERLEPLLARLQISRESPDSKLVLDGDPKTATDPAAPLELGNLTLETEHKLEFVAGNGTAEISFKALPAQLPEFQVTVQRSTPPFVFLSSFGGKARVYSSTKLRLSLDGGSTYSDLRPGVLELEQLPEDGVLTIQDSNGVTRPLAASTDAVPTLQAFFLTAKPAVLLGAITIDSSEADFALLIDGKQFRYVRKASSYVVSNLPEGLHQVQLQKDGFRTEPESVSADVKANRIAAINVRWIPLPTSLTIIGALPGTRVAINSRALVTDSKGELRTDLQPGSNSLALSKEGYESKNFERSLTPGSQWTLGPAQSRLEATRGTFIFVKQQPTRGIRLTIRQATGVPMEGPETYAEIPEELPLPVGTYSFTFEADGYKPDKVTAGILKSQRLPIPISLVR
jgi:hypothetical protein